MTRVRRVLKRLTKLRGRSITFVTVPDAGGTIRQWKMPFPVLAVILLILVTTAASVTYLVLSYGARVAEATTVRKKMQEVRQENERLIVVIDEQETRLSELAAEAEALNSKVVELETISSQLEQVLKTRVSEMEGKQSGVPKLQFKPPMEVAARGGEAQAGLLVKTEEQLAVLREVVPQSAQRLTQLRNSVQIYSDRRARMPSIWPVVGRVTSRFGTRLHPIEKVIRPHDGIDISAAQGTPIVATANGVVSFSGWKGGYGWTVIIDHGYGVKTLYAHNKRNVVQTGRRVSRGEVIAYVGSTGISTGPHVHYEVQLNGKPVDPEKYLP